MHRIAVVGNSPNIKQALQGDEIDSADTVIRFNNSLLNNSNRKHCGQRTDVWVMSPSTSVQQCPPDAKAIIVSGLHALTRPSFYWKRLAGCGKSLSEFPADVWYELVRQFQAPPSAGALLLASLDQMSLPLDIRYYGFTTDPNELHSTANHHVDNTPRSNRHNWQAETQWLADRIAQRKTFVITS